MDPNCWASGVLVFDGNFFRTKSSATRFFIISNKLPRAEITSFPIIENCCHFQWYKINFWHFDEKSMYRWSSPMRTFVHFIHPFPLKGQIPDAILTKPRRFQRAVRFSPFYFFGFMYTNPHFLLSAEAQNERLRKSPNLRVLRQKTTDLVMFHWNGIDGFGFTLLGCCRGVGSAGIKG